MLHNFIKFLLGQVIASGYCLFFSQALIKLSRHGIHNILIEIRIVKELLERVVVLKEEACNNILELIREQRVHEHLRIVVLRILSELLDIRVVHKHLVDAFNDNSV